MAIDDDDGMLDSSDTSDIVRDYDLDNWQNPYF